MKRLALVLLFTATPLFAQRALTVDDFAAIRDVGDPQLSPDGTQVLYTVRQADLKDDKNHTHIWRASWDGKESTQITYSTASESSPRWSPDGTRIAFLSSRGVDNEADQLWIMSSAGGEAEKVTDFKGSVDELDWSPDSKRLVLTVEDPDPTEAEDKKKTKPPVVIDRFQFKQDKIGYLTAKRQHLYLFDVSTKKSEPLTPDAFDEYQPAWSPDGSLIAFVSKRGSDPDRTRNFDLYVIEPHAGAAPRQLTTFPGADNDPEIGSPLAWSPDAKSIAYLQGGDPKLIDYATRHLAVIPAAGGTPTIVTAALDRNVTRPQWSPDGRALYFIVEDDRTEVLDRMPAGGGAIETVAGGKRVITTYDVARNGNVAIVSTDDLHPAELFTLDGRPLSQQNRDFLAQVKLAGVEDIELPSKDGTQIHGFVVNARKNAPAILRIHGGPQSQFAHRFSFEWQLFAANGYTVVAANPRGSTGRGEAFCKAIWADWGHLDAQDVLAAVDFVVKRGMADPKRLGVGGWSYGGMLTNYVIAQDTRFRAATSGASISNILAGYGTDQYVRDYEAELGRPWEHPEIWTRISFPFLHADRVKTPTLFLAGDRDFNVPLLNSEQMYEALRSLGVPAELIIYPGQFHGITKPSYVKDRYDRYLAWYAKYLK